ncbi:MAG: MBL fold metallo-hydrolase [Verrucomicrobiota bacterium]|jgi:ribonuclease Z
MHPVSLKCFGVGDGWACPDRNHSSFLYRLGRNSFLIDCGEPISGSLKASGLDYESIDRIFVSHLHCDHIGGFFMLMQGLWLEQRKRDLPVHMPAYGIAPVHNMLEAAYIFDDLLPFRLDLVPLRADEPVVFGDVTVTVFPTTHLEGLRKAFQKKYPQPFVAFSFLIEANGLRIAHSADLGAPDDLDPLLEKPVDLLVCELAHFRPEELFRYLQDRPVKRVVFIHLARACWENLAETRALAKKMLGKMDFTFAKDGDEIEIKQPRPNPARRKTVAV